MNKKNLIEWGIFLLLVCTLFSFFLLVGIPLLVNGSFATEETYKLCVEDNMYIVNIIGIDYSGCIVESCEEEFGGITYCETKYLKIINGKFFE